MTDQERLVARYKRGLKDMTPEERKAVREALKRPYADKMDIVEIVAARGRSLARKRSDLKTDIRRRTLIGAPLPRETVEKYRLQAEREGMSLYKYTAAALERMYQETDAREGAEAAPGMRASFSGARPPWGA